MTRPLAGFQQDALRFLGLAGRGIYGDPPGSRKTATSLLLAADKPGRTLIVTPANVLKHWVEEAAEAVPDYPVDWYRGSDTATKRARAVESWLQDGGALITNYEAVRRDVDWLRKAKIRNLFFDEAHRLKNRTSQVHRAASLLSTQSKDMVAITGTPLMNRAEELWALLHMVDRRRYSSFWAWAEEHFYVKSTTFGKPTRFPVRLVGNIRPGHDVLLQRELVDVLLFRTIEEIMPELGSEPSWTTLTVALKPEERRRYDKMVQHGWVEADNAEGFVTAEGVALTTRLRQLVGEWSEVGDGALGSKARAAVDLAEDLDEPVVILTAHAETARRIAVELNGVLHTGRVNAAARELNVRRFMTGAERVIVGTIASLGVGVDGLQRNARHLIFVDLDWVYDVNRQAVGRLWRSGQTKPVSVWAISAEDTIDEVVAEANKQQKDVKDLILGESWQDLVKGRLHEGS